MAVACKNHDLCWWSVSDTYVVSIVLHWVFAWFFLYAHCMTSRFCTLTFKFFSLEVMTSWILTIENPAWPGGEQSKGRKSQGANQPRGEKARGRTSQGRTGKGAKKPYNSSVLGCRCQQHPNPNLTTTMYPVTWKRLLFTGNQTHAAHVERLDNG